MYPAVLVLFPFPVINKPLWETSQPENEGLISNGLISWRMSATVYNLAKSHRNLTLLEIRGERTKKCITSFIFLLSILLDELGTMIFSSLVQSSSFPLASKTHFICKQSYRGNVPAWPWEGRKTSFNAQLISPLPWSPLSHPSTPSPTASVVQTCPFAPATCCF